MKFLSQLALIYLFCMTFAFSSTPEDTVGDSIPPASNTSVDEQEINPAEQTVPGTGVGSAGALDPSATPFQMSADLTKLVTYFKNLGLYLGFDLEVVPTLTTPALLNMTVTAINQLFPLKNEALIDTLLRAIPVNTADDTSSQKASSLFVPSDPDGTPLAGINDNANGTFAPQFSTADSKTTVSAISLIDQPSSKGGYLADPVSQAIFNILGTPDFSACTAKDANALLSTCYDKYKIKYQSKVKVDVLGDIPSYSTYFTYDYNKALIGQLNSNALLGPLLYSREALSQSEGVSVGASSGGAQTTGLGAQTQVQLASNFIRYVTSSFLNPTPPQYSSYKNLLEDANPSESELNTQEGQIKQAIAQNTLSNFWLSIRTYAAQTSVAVSNLNFMLAKRLPTNEEANASSQALNEYRMATWRLFTSSGQAEQDKPNQKWIKELGKAEPGTVQIEIAQLLAEINYQMYLDRQIQERILLANSILLIQNLKMNPPRLDTSSGGGKNKN